MSKYYNTTFIVFLFDSNFWIDLGEKRPLAKTSDKFIEVDVDFVDVPPGALFISFFLHLCWENSEREGEEVQTWTKKSKGENKKKRGMDFIFLRLEIEIWNFF